MQLIFSYKKLQLYLLGKTLFKFTNIIRMIHDFNGIQKMFVSPYCLLYIFFFPKYHPLVQTRRGVTLVLYCLWVLSPKLSWLEKSKYQTSMNQNFILES